MIEWGFPQIRGTLLGGPHNKDYSVLVSILGFPYFGKLPNILVEGNHSINLGPLKHHPAIDFLVLKGGAGEWK